MTLTVWVKRLIVVKVSEETIRNILCRDSLIADEFVKFQVGDFKTNNSFNPILSARQMNRVNNIILDYLPGCLDVVQEQL